MNTSIICRSKIISSKNSFRKYSQILQSIKMPPKDNAMSFNKKSSNSKDKSNKIFRVLKRFNMSIKDDNWKSIKKKNKFGNFKPVLLNLHNQIMTNSLLLIVSKFFKIKESAGIISDTWVREFQKKVEIAMIF